MRALIEEQGSAGRTAGSRMLSVQAARHGRLVLPRFALVLLLAVAASVSIPAAEPTAKPASGAHHPELVRFFERLQRGDATTVVFFGGSITYGAFDVPEVEKNETLSYRALVGAHLRKLSPTGNVKLIDAAIGSTGSDLGVFRMERDVLPNAPDLVFVEFAVNGGGQEAMEGIIRKLKRVKPDAAVVLVIVGTGADGTIKLPDERDAHLALAKLYGLPCVDIAGATRTMIERRKAMLTDFFPGADTTHPREKGHAIYADLIIAEIEKAPTSPVARGNQLPRPLTKNRFENASMIELSRVLDLGDWQSARANSRGRWFDQTPSRWLDSAVQPKKAGAILPIGEIACSGIGLYFEATQGGGAVEVRVDGKARLTANTEFGAGDEGRAVVRYAFTFLGASAKHDVRLVAAQAEKTVAAYLLVAP